MTMKAGVRSKRYSMLWCWLDVCVDRTLACLVITRRLCVQEKKIQHRAESFVNCKLLLL